MPHVRQIVESSIAATQRHWQERLHYTYMAREESQRLDADGRAKEEIDKLKRETPEQRAERLRKEEEESTSLVREVPKAFDFQLVGQDVVGGRPADVLQATPRDSSWRGC